MSKTEQLTMSIQRIEPSPSLHSHFQEKKSPLKPTHYVPLKYSYLSEWWWREVPLKKEWSHSKWPTKISKKPPARASLAVALIFLLSTQDIPKCQLSLLAPRSTSDICGTLLKILPPMMPTYWCQFQTFLHCWKHMATFMQRTKQFMLRIDSYCL